MFVGFGIFAVSGKRMRFPVDGRRESSDDHSGACGYNIHSWGEDKV